MDFIRHPKTRTELAAEIKKACDSYWGREITEAQLKEILYHWALKENKKLFQGQEINPTIKIKLGVKRLDLVNNMLDGLQNKLI